MDCSYTVAIATKPLQLQQSVPLTLNESKVQYAYVLPVWSR